jgi:hypothetical protein
MWHAMFAGQIPLAEKILRTVIVYGLLAVLFRLIGEQGLASMNTFDLVVTFLLSSVAQNAVSATRPRPVTGRRRARRTAEILIKGQGSSL